VSRLGPLLILVVGAAGLTAGIFWSARAPDASTAAPSAVPRAEAPATVSAELAAPADTAADRDASSGEPPRAVRGRERAEVPLAAVESEEEDSFEYATVRLLVRSKETGAPVAGAQASAWSNTGFSRSRHRLDPEVTGPDGRMELRVRAGESSTVSVFSLSERHGFANAIVPPLDPAEAIDLTLEVTTEAEATFRGRVVAAESSEPIAGARVAIRATTYWRADSAGGYSGRTYDSVATDASGSFSIPYRALTREGLHALVGAPGRVPRTVALESVPLGAPPVDIPLRLGGVLIASVVSPDGGPLTGVEVRAISSARLLDEVYVGDRVWSAETGVNGRVRLEGLEPDTNLALDLRTPDDRRRRRQDSLLLAPGEQRQITLVVGGGATIRGLVERVGQTRRSYNEVALRPAGADQSDPRARQVWTDGQGRFQFEDVPDGDWVTALVSSQFACADESVLVRGGLADREVTLRGHRGLVVSGLVLGLRGEPVGGANVSASNLEGDVRASAKTNSAGEFEVGPLVPGGVRLRAFSHFLAPSEEVTAEAGAEGVVLRPRPGGRIRGVVVGLDGEAVAAEVSAWSDDSLRRQTTATHTGFLLGGLEPGAYELMASTGDSGEFGYHPPVLVTVGGQAEVRIQLEPSARLRIRNKSGGNAQVAVKREGTIVHRGTVRPGAGDLVFVPTGDLTVTFDLANATSVRTVANQETEVVYGEDEP